MKKIIRGLQALDYIVGAAVIAYGVYGHSWLTVGLGLGGLALARMNLAERISGKLQKYLNRKQIARQSVLEPEREAPTPLTTAHATSNYQNLRMTPGILQIGSSRHSVLRVASSLNHAEGNKTSR